jgi:hypothetical protein
MIKLLDLLKEDNPFVPRGTPKEREQEYERITQNIIQQYIKDGMKGDLELGGQPVTSLPPNLTKVGGELGLRNTPITLFPSNLKVEGNLILTGALITSLPDNLTVGRNLDIDYTDVDKLPSNLTVGRDLYLRDTLITSLPSDLKVGNNLTLHNTPLSKKYSKDEIRAMVPNVKGEIYT